MVAAEETSYASIIRDACEPAPTTIFQEDAESAEQDH